MKRCPKCGGTLPLSNFTKDKKRRDGLSCWCRECNKKNVKAHRSCPDVAEQRRVTERNRYYFDPDKVKKRSAEWYKANADRAKKTNALALRKRMICPIFRLWETVRQRDWYQRNSAKGIAKTRKRQLLQSKATPKWLTSIQDALIHEMYEISVARSVQTGILHHVDHIHPLNGENFCGLHVPWNLDVIPASINCAKANLPPQNELNLFWGLG